MLDTILKNGRIVDGTGNPWYKGNIGIKNNKIVQLDSGEYDAHQIIDVNGNFIAPGFIDGHCHSDLMVLDFPESEIKLHQGVTTEVVGNCGLAPAPVNPLNREDLQRYVEPVLGKANKEWLWQSIEEYFTTLDQELISENTASYVAHGSVRIAVMGFANRKPTKQEMEEMKHIVEEGMKAGAIGLSIGLLYAPGSYSTKEEIAELCKVVAKYDGLFATHIRGEGNNLLPSIKEVIWIAEQSGVALHISHLKAAGKRNWGQVDDAMNLIEDCRARGMDVTCDVYPYSAGSTMLTTIFPPWSLEGGIAKVLEGLKDSKFRQQVKEELLAEQDTWDNLVLSTGWDNVIIASIHNPLLKSYEGKSILAIGESLGKDPIDTAFDLLLQENGNIGIVYFHMDEKDVVNIMKYRNSLIASDSLTCYTGKPHPRLYGTFPRVIEKYVKKDRILTLEEAVRKMSSFPAKRFNLKNRGLIADSYSADLTVFDFEQVREMSTYEDPKQLPKGIEYVFVNGKLTIDQDHHTQEKNGCFLKHHIK